MYTLKFLARGDLLVHRFGLPSGHYVGRVHDASLGPNGGWPKSKEPTVVVCDITLFHEYKRLVAEGDLWPADEDTARLCGVKFDSTFGADEELKAESSKRKSALPTPA